VELDKEIFATHKLCKALGTGLSSPAEEAVWVVTASREERTDRRNIQTASASGGSRMAGRAHISRALGDDTGWRSRRVRGVSFTIGHADDPGRRALEPAHDAGSCTHNTPLIAAGKADQCVAPPASSRAWIAYAEDIGDRVSSLGVAKYERPGTSAWEKFARECADAGAP
jgi:hypothetical protein